MALHTLLACAVALGLAFAWQAVVDGEGAAGTAASLAAVLGLRD
jgi:hypothetical protein